MKTLIVILLLVAATTVSQSQNVTLLPEVKIGVSALNAKVIRSGDQFTIKIDKVHAPEFGKNPIAFMKSYLDMKSFIANLSDEEYDSYQVTFKSQKGNMVANFDDEGNLVNTRQSFKNILLPYNLRRDLYTAYQGWIMTKNKYDATTKGEIINKETYRITFRKGKQKENVTIDGNNKGLSVASN